MTHKDDRTKEQKKPTREDYMSRRVTHTQYYQALCKTAGVSYKNAKPKFLDRVWKCMQEGDEHLNRIPLANWDSRTIGLLPSAYEAFRLHGDIPSQAGLVCLIKQAARDAAIASRGE